MTTGQRRAVSSLKTMMIFDWLDSILNNDDSYLKIGASGLLYIGRATVQHPVGAVSISFFGSCFPLVG